MVWRNRVLCSSLFLLLLQDPYIKILMQVLLTPSDLAIVMEYAAGGELFERICNAGRFSEDEVYKFLKQQKQIMIQIFHYLSKIMNYDHSFFIHL